MEGRMRRMEGRMIGLGGEMSKMKVDNKSIPQSTNINWSPDPPHVVHGYSTNLIIR